MKNTEALEQLREMLVDQKVHLCVGSIKEIDLAKDRSALWCRVELWPGKRTVIARMTWADVGADSGTFSFPAKDDLVLVGFSEGQEDLAFVLTRLSTKSDPIPQIAATGDWVGKARIGKKAHLVSDTRINIGKGGAVQPAQALVLGNVLKEFLGNVLDALLDAPQIGQSAMGPVFLDPGVRAELVEYKETYLDQASTNILSQLAFTERGT